MQETLSENNKKIIKNTLALYFRQIIILIVSLYTSRVILRTLGIEDYGINNVVGGIVAMLSFITSSLSATTQRFLSVELGKNDFIKLKQIFSNSLSLHLIYIFFTVIIAETAGIWFFKNKLVIPYERITAAYWVYQFSVISFVVSVFFTPFEGAIKAHEKFNFYAKLSILEVILKLAIVYLILYSRYDKLITYSFLLMCVVILNKIILFIYSYKYFEECRIRFTWFKDSIRPLLGYNIFTIINSISALIRYQGLNIVLNFYYGPILNAAHGIASQILATLTSFTNNAALAVQPQIIMSYTQNDKQRLWSLVEKSSRLFFYLFLFLSLPFILEIHTVLYIWLGDYPDYTPIFTRLFLLETITSVWIIPVIYANSAVGKLLPVTISNVISRLIILFCAIYIGYNNISPNYIYISVIVFQGIHLIICTIIILKHQLEFSLKKYFFDVFIPIIRTSFFVVSVPIVLHIFLSKSIFSSCLVLLATFFWSALIIFFIGLKSQEKLLILNRLRYFVRNIFSNNK